MPCLLRPITSGLLPVWVLLPVPRHRPWDLLAASRGCGRKRRVPSPCPSRPLRPVGQAGRLQKVPWGRSDPWVLPPGESRPDTVLALSSWCSRPASVSEDVSSDVRLRKRRYKETTCPLSHRHPAEQQTRTPSLSRPGATSPLWP